MWCNLKHVAKMPDVVSNAPSLRSSVSGTQATSWFDWLGGSMVASSAARPIVLINRRALQRDCLGRVLAAEFSDQLILTFASVEDWRQASSDHKLLPLVLLYDGDEPHDLELMATGSPQAAPATPVILLSGAEDPASIFNALDSGIKGYIPHNSWIDVAIEATRLVIAGGVYIPAASLIKATRTPIASKPAVQSRPHTQFTPRQLSIIAAVSKGKANAAIAYELNLCESTVKVHIRNIMKKLKAKNRTEIAYKSKDILLAEGYDINSSLPSPARGAGKPGEAA